MNNKTLSYALLISAISLTACAPKSTIMILNDAATSTDNTPPAQQSNLRTVSGVVSAIVNQPLSKKAQPGFYLQDPIGDNDPLTTDAIFVVATPDKVSVGDSVTVSGMVKKTNGVNSLYAQQITPNDNDASLTATPLRLLKDDSDFSQTLARHQGMLVTLDAPSQMFVSRSYGYDRSARRNNLALSYKGVSVQANQQHIPNSKGARAQHQANITRQLTVESLTRSNRGEISWYPQFAKDASNHIRIGDRIESLTGIISYYRGQYRLLVTQPATKQSFAATLPRTLTPQLKQGDVKIATFNVLNYFNSPFGGDNNPLNQNRGAKTIDGFKLQGTKVVTAIVALDADIIGLMEIENNGYGEKSALVNLIDKINKKLPAAKQYRFVQPDNQKFIGTGAITSQVIYRPSSVSVEALKIIEMPQQHAPRIGKESGINFMRDTLAPTFILNDSKTRLTVSVNHFKSKGSTCWEDVALQNNRNVDRQGSCENFRVSGAYHLGQQLAKIDGHKLIIGDLNSYAGEDPVTVLTNRDALPKDYQISAARDTYIGGDKTSGKLLHGENGSVINQSFGYINTVKKHHPDAFGYSYKNVVGTLDYVLVSPSLVSHVVDVMEWNINSPESTLLEYPSKYTGKMKKFSDPYRSSDHDPVIISLKF